ncbi:MAG: IS200/IS605 family element transposase accessory protein TnpB [Candidatus Heimdallarchaeota archaeon]
MRKNNIYLKRVYADVLYDVTRRLDKAYRFYFRERKKGNYNFGKPKFKKWVKYSSFTYTTPGRRKIPHKFRIDNKQLYLGKIGFVKIIIDRSLPLNAKMKTCTIKRDVNHWYACIDCELNQSIETRKIVFTKAIGIDVGLYHYGTLSNGEQIVNPLWLREKEMKLAREQIHLSRKVYGSKNWEKQAIKVAIIHRKIRNQRRDYLHKISSEIVEKYDIICLEKIMIQNIVKNRRLAKSINDASWGIFKRMLQYKAAECGKKVVLVPPHNTSQICCMCGKKVKKEIGRKWHKCPDCLVVLHRYVNASRNILKKGLELLQSSNDITTERVGCARGVTS